jgi:hypothetical protein
MNETQKWATSKKSLRTAELVDSTNPTGHSVENGQV